MKSAMKSKVPFAMVMLFSRAALAQSNLEGAVSNVLSLATRMMFVVAGVAALFGMVQAGIALSQGDNDAKRKMTYAFGGAGVIALGAVIVRAIFAAAGNSSIALPGG